MINTILSAVGAATAISIQNMLTLNKVDQSQNVTLKFDLVQIVGAIMSGCVAGTASCNNIHLSSALIIGVVAGLIYKATVYLFERLEIDDPLQVSQIHGFCGLWGVLAVGIFDKDNGLIYSGQFSQLGIQTVGILAQLAWNCAFAITFFKLMKTLGKFRVGQAFELLGMDHIEDCYIR